MASELRVNKLTNRSGLGTVTYTDTGAIVTGIVTATGDFSVADKIVHTGDTNTAIRFPTADTITAETGGGERLRIASTGQVLIGTTTEGHANADELTVSKSTGVMGMTLRSDDSSNCHFYFSDATSGAGEYAGFINYQHSDNSLHIGANSAERLRIDSSGRLLINNTSADGDNKIQIYGTSDDMVQIRMKRTNAIGSNAIYGGLDIVDNNNADVASIRAHNEGGATAAYIAFKTYASGGSLGERLRIDSAGDVGVNITDPIAQLQVNSTRNAKTDRHSAANYHLALRNPADDNNEAIGLSFGITSNATKVGAAILHERDAGGSQGSLQFYTSSDGNSLSERLRIGSAGQFGIGGANWGSSGQVLTSGGSGAAVSWATAGGGGKILQVVQEHKTDTWSESVAQGAKSGAAITKAITTSASNSKVLVTISLTIGWNDQTGRTGVVLKRGGTEIALSDSTGDNKVRLLTCSEMNNSQWCEPIAFTYLDSPGSAATHTYTIHLWHGYQDTFTAYLNRAGYETNHNYRGRGTSSITLMEVSA